MGEIMTTIRALEARAQRERVVHAHVEGCAECQQGLGVPIIYPLDAAALCAVGVILLDAARARGAEV